MCMYTKNYGLGLLEILKDREEGGDGSSLFKDWRAQNKSEDGNIDLSVYWHMLHFIL